MKDWRIIVIIALAVLLFISLYRQITMTCYNLPSVSDPARFGPHYWKALHSTVEKIPCPTCRRDGTSLMIFMHDIVNAKLGKKITDQQNFDKWSAYVDSIKNGTAKTEQA